MSKPWRADEDVVRGRFGAIEGEDWREPLRTGTDEYQLHRQSVARAEAEAEAKARAEEKAEAKSQTSRPRR